MSSCGSRIHFSRKGWSLYSGKQQKDFTHQRHGCPHWRGGRSGFERARTWRRGPSCASVLLEPNWSWTRSDKMRGEIQRLGSNLGWPPNGTCVLTAGPAQGHGPWGYRASRYCTSVATARRQQGCSSTSRTRRRAIRTVPVNGSRCGYGIADHVGPMSADLPDVQG